MSKILYLNFFKLFIVLSFGFRYKRIIQNMRFCLFASAFWSIQIKKINFGQLAENPLEGLVSIIIAKSAFLIQIALDLVQDTQAYEISMNSGHFLKSGMQFALKTAQIMVLLQNSRSTFNCSAHQGHSIFSLGTFTKP